MHDPDTLIKSFGPFDLWHHDPCKGGGGDDSCGWHKRARHGDPLVRAKIRADIAYDFDKSYQSEGSGNVYFRGLFCPNGDPNFSVHAIVVNFFFIAAIAHFGTRARAARFCQSNLFEILHFAENPFDSMRDGIVRTFGEDTKREERINSMADCVYGWILRADQKWWQHPRWHLNHWRLTCRPFWRRTQSAKSLCSQ